MNKANMWIVTGEGGNPMLVEGSLEDVKFYLRSHRLKKPTCKKWIEGTIEEQIAAATNRSMIRDEMGKVDGEAKSIMDG